MTVVAKRSVLSGIPVSEAMRKQVIMLPKMATIGQGIRLMIRYRVHAILLTDNGIPCGVASKTDLMSAFYAELPTETPIGDVMGSQPIACFPDDLLEDALEIMEAAGVHRLYVTGANREDVVGTVGHSDIVGLLYRYCRKCEHGTTQKRVKRSGTKPETRLRVVDVMTRDVVTNKVDEPLFGVIETLSAHNMSAVLILDEAQSPVGVISKTDLIIAYHHGVQPGAEAREIMHTPIYTISIDALLSEAIQEMLVRDVQRLFVHDDALAPNHIGGVLALSDSARFRSGSCRACIAGRILTQS